MQKQNKISKIVRLKNGVSLGLSSDKCYRFLSAEQETALLFDIAKAMKLSVSEEEIRAAVDHFKEKESAAER